MLVDDFIDGEEYKGKRYTRDELYARWVLMQLRLPAALHLAFREFIPKLFCTHAGTRYRVTLASVMGDVGLSRTFSKEYGYDVRVMVDECSNWGDKP